MRAGLSGWRRLLAYSIAVPNPKTSGNGRYTYLAAWGYALDRTKSEAAAREFCADKAGRSPATKTFSVEQVLGGWNEVQAKHFADGAVYDQIIVKR